MRANLHPTELVVLKGGHFDAYGKDFDKAAKPACRWFAQHLLPRRVARLQRV